MHSLVPANTWSPVLKHLMLSLKPEASFPRRRRRRDAGKQLAESQLASLLPRPAPLPARPAHQPLPPPAHGSEALSESLALMFAEESGHVLPGPALSGQVGLQARGGGLRGNPSPLDACPGLSVSAAAAGARLGQT